MKETTDPLSSILEPLQRLTPESDLREAARSALYALEDALADVEHLTRMEARVYRGAARRLRRALGLRLDDVGSEGIDLAALAAGK